MNKIINAILYYIFGEWNGVQNFVAPTVLLFLFNQSSFINWMTGVLTYQRFFLPLLVYCIVLFSVIFLCIKVLVQWKDEYANHKPRAGVSVFRDFLIPFIIKLHKWLLLFLTVIILIYVIKNAYTFVYRGSFPLFVIYYWVLRVGTIFMTLYLFVFLQIAIPIVKKGRSLNWAQQYFHKFIIKRWKSVFPIITVQLLWIYVSILLFTLAIEQLQNLNDLGFLTTNGKPIEVIFMKVHNLKQFIYNASVLCASFLVSNLLYSPLMLLASKGFRHFKLTLKNI
jgi:hypothetical protein